MAVNVAGKEVAQQELPFKKRNHDICCPRMIGQPTFVTVGALWIASLFVARDYARSPDFTFFVFPLLCEETKNRKSIYIFL